MPRFAKSEDIDCLVWNDLAQKELWQKCKPNTFKVLPNHSKLTIWKLIFGHVDRKINYDRHPVQM